MQVLRVPPFFLLFWAILGLSLGLPLFPALGSERTHGYDFECQSLIHPISGQAKSVREILGMFWDRIVPRPSGPLTFGVEIEGAYPRGQSVYTVPLIIRQVMHERFGFKEPIFRDDDLVYYTIPFLKYHRPSVWTIHEEETFPLLHASQFPLEVSTPILRDDEDLDMLDSVLRRLSMADFHAYPLGAGVHVHVGLPDASTDELKFLMIAFSLIQKRVLRFFSASNFRMPFVDMLPQPILNRLVDPTSQSDLAALDSFFVWLRGNARKNVAVNVLPLITQETIEFRLFNSTLQPRLVRFCVAFARRWLKAIREKDESLLTFLETASTSRSISVNALADFMGMHPDEVEFVMKQFNKELSRALD
jgi:hypothetical protein